MSFLSKLFGHDNNSHEVDTSRTNDAIEPIKQLTIPNQFRKFNIHEDIKYLLWLEDEKRPDVKGVFETIECCGIKLTVSTSIQEEPSLIYKKHNIKEPEDISAVPRPNYYPRFRELTPEQTWVYLKLLCNPYDTSIDIGYVFLLYYGLERHLFQGNFDDAFRVILKLRDVHKNKSFQSYSSRALILSAMLRGKGEFVPEFLLSLDKEYEYNIDGDLLLLCLFSFNIPIQPKEIMRFSDTFEFTNKNYIKKYPDIFEKCLIEVLIEKNNEPFVSIEKYITKPALNKLSVLEMTIFANMSIFEKSIPVPQLSSNFMFKKDVYGFLEEAHERAKKIIAELRKSGNLEPPKESSLKVQHKRKTPEEKEKERIERIKKEYEKDMAE